MIGSTRLVSVFAYCLPVDMRKSYDTLAAVVTSGFGRDVLCGDIFVFVRRDRRRAKVLWWDGTGLCLLAKRLSKGRFAAPWASKSQEAIVWTMSELALFLEGSEAIGRIQLSPAPWTQGERTVTFK